MDEFVSHHQKLEDINKGFDDMHVGISIPIVRCMTDQDTYDRLETVSGVS